jgi:anthranilate synthase/aminodeoxychorismate synthase-like glutamine amidotransferase
LLIIDNYDSFVYNLDQLVRDLGARTDVVRNDVITPEEVIAAFQQKRFDGIIVSPGPGSPKDAGISTAVIRRLGPAVRILGVCLGHQCIAEAYGGQVVRAGEVLHGKQSFVHHDGEGVFRGLDAPLLAARYHSLVVSEQSLPPELRVTARTATNVVMGIRHREHPVEGLQIHPESILTLRGRHLLENFLEMCATDGSPGRVTTRSRDRRRQHRADTDRCR